MGAFEKFVESEAFFPVLLLLLVMLLAVFIWVLVSGKRDEKKRRALKSNVVVDEDAQVKIIQTEDNKEVEMPAIVKEVEQVQEMVESKEVQLIQEEVVVKPKEVKEVPRIDIPINKMDETPIVVPSQKREVEVGETITVEEATPLVENEIKSDEIVKVNAPTENIQNDEIGEEIIVEKTMPLTEEKSEEYVITDAVVDTKREETPIHNENLAFNSTPDDNSEINESIVVEEPKEYLGEKTEIFDFPDFDAPTSTDTVDIEKEIIDAANKYIESIMAKH